MASDECGECGSQMDGWMTSTNHPVRIIQQGVAVGSVVPELYVGLDVCPGGDAGEKGFAGGDFWRANICKGGAGVSVQGRECDIVKVDKTYI